MLSHDSDQSLGDSRPSIRSLSSSVYPFSPPPFCDCPPPRRRRRFPSFQKGGERRRRRRKYLASPSRGGGERVLFVGIWKAHPIPPPAAPHSFCSYIPRWEGPRPSPSPSLQLLYSTINSLRPSSSSSPSVASSFSYSSPSPALLPSVLGPELKREERGGKADRETLKKVQQKKGRIHLS